MEAGGDQDFVNLLGLGRIKFNFHTLVHTVVVEVPGKKLGEGVVCIGACIIRDKQ